MKDSLYVSSTVKSETAGDFLQATVTWDWPIHLRAVGCTNKQPGLMCMVVAIMGWWP